MTQETFPASDRILCDIEMVFKRDPLLKDFDIIPVTVNQNKSPVVHVEHCLGLELWSVRHVYCYAYNHIMTARQHPSRKEDPSLLSRFLTGCLLINPDISSFWNMRREMVQAGTLKSQSELHFTAVVLSRKPKCPEAFAYRKWILSKLILDSIDVRELLQEELRVTQCAADRYPNNYHAWNHRMWCMTRLSPLISDASSSYISEWKTSETWICSHVSDHSGLQYRQFLLTKLIYLDTSALQESFRHSVVYHLQNLPEMDGHTLEEDDKYNHSKYLFSDLELNTELILKFGGHEALWCHRRFLLTVLKDTIFNNLGIGINSATKNQLCVKNSFYERKELQNSCPNQFGDESNNNNGVSVYTILGEYSHMNSDGIPLKKDQKLSNSDEIEELLISVIAAQETNLVKRCCGDETHYQFRLAMIHSVWLSRALKISLQQSDE